MYFNFGKLWNPIQRITKYSNNDMFNNFNKPAIDYAINIWKNIMIYYGCKNIKSTNI